MTKHKDDYIITGRLYLTGEAVKFTLEDGLIANVEKAGEDDDNSFIIAPGLTDLQVNGYAGLDLNTDPLLPETVRDISVKLWSEGVTTFFPTIITNSSDRIENYLSVVADACSRFPEAAGAIGGIHLEGPFISPENGARGAHPAEYVRPPDWNLFCEWQEACGGMIRIITLSPEWPDSADFIRRAAASGVTVSIGHTAATPEQIRDAVTAGATLSTHLGNGSHQMLPRHRNYIWEQLAADELYASIISDGFHLPDAVMKVFLRMKPGRIILVSDATGLTGMPPGDYTTHIGGEVTLTEAGKLHVKGNPDMLAGSGKSLLHCVETIVSMGLVSLAEALDMAGRTPYRLAGLPGDCLPVTGGVADLVLLSEVSGGLQVVRTVKAGQTVFRTEI
ncbi:MAG: N-acetylglucosamine-6-phosphate deacetylase [Bacteroidales bacterium]